MKTKLLGLVLAIALMLAFIDVAVVPSLVNKHDESRTDVIYTYEFSEQNDSVTVLQAIAGAVNQVLMQTRNSTDYTAFPWKFEATDHYVQSEIWSDWHSMNDTLFLHNINYTILTIQHSGDLRYFRVSHIADVYDHTDVKMLFSYTHLVTVQNDNWFFASLLFNVCVVGALIVFCVQNWQTSEEEDP